LTQRLRESPRKRKKRRKKKSLLRRKPQSRANHARKPPKRTTNSLLICYLSNPVGLIEKIFAPLLVGASHITDDLTIDVDRERLWFFQQVHSCLFRRAISLAIVAATTAGDQIVPA